MRETGQSILSLSRFVNAVTTDYPLHKAVRRTFINASHLNSSYEPGQARSLAPSSFSSLLTIRPCALATSWSVRVRSSAWKVRA